MNLLAIVNKYGFFFPAKISVCLGWFCGSDRLFIQVHYICVHRVCWQSIIMLLLLLLSSLVGCAIKSATEFSRVLSQSHWIYEFIVWTNSYEWIQWSFCSPYASQFIEIPVHKPLWHYPSFLCTSRTDLCRIERSKHEQKLQKRDSIRISHSIERVQVRILMIYQTHCPKMYEQEKKNLYSMNCWCLHCKISILWIRVVHK